MSSSETDRPTTDFLALRLGIYDWSDPESARTAVQEVYDAVLDQALGTIRWYYRKRRVFRIRAQWLRIFATVLAIFGGLMPLAQLNFGDALAADLSLDFSDLGYLLIALAAALLAFNKYLGYSGAWIRYVLAALKIKKLVEDFQFAWAERLANGPYATTDAEPTTADPATDPEPQKSPGPNQQVLQLLRLAREFSNQVNEMALDETKTWATEFSSDLAALEALVKKDGGSLGQSNPPAAH